MKVPGVIDLSFYLPLHSASLIYCYQVVEPTVRYHTFSSHPPLTLTPNLEICALSRDAHGSQDTFYLIADRILGPKWIFRGFRLRVRSRVPLFGKQARWDVRQGAKHCPSLRGVGAFAKGKKTMRAQNRFLVSLFSMRVSGPFLAVGLGMCLSGLAVPPRATAQIVPPGPISSGPLPIPATQAFEPPACSDEQLGGVNIDLGIFGTHNVPSPLRGNPEWKAIILDSNQPPNLQPPTILEGFVSPQPSDQTSTSQSTAEVAEEDLPWTHHTHDFTFKVVPDPPYQHLLASWTSFPGVTFTNTDNLPLVFFSLACASFGGSVTDTTPPETCVIPPEVCPYGITGPTCQYQDMEVEWDNASYMDEHEGFQRIWGAVPEFVWPAVGDRVWVAGRWIFDCGHPNPPGADPYDPRYVKFSTEIHPPRALVTFRLNHPALDSFVVPRPSAPNFPFPQSYLPVTGCPVGSLCGPAALPPGVPNSGSTNVPVTEADIFVSVNGGAASDICSIVRVPCSDYGGHTGPIIPVNDRNYVFDIYPPGTGYVLKNGIHLANGTFPVTPPVPDASLQWRTEYHFTELPTHACGGVNNTVCVTVEPIFCLIDASTPPPDQSETGCPPLPAQPTRLRVILPFAGTNANYFARSILLGWDDVPEGGIQILGATKMSGDGLLNVSASKMSRGGLLNVSASKMSGGGLLNVSASKMSGGGLPYKSATTLSAPPIGGLSPGSPTVRSFVERLHKLTVNDNGEGCCTNGDWRVFVNVGGQWRYMDPYFEAKDDGTSVCNGADPLTNNGNGDCYLFDNIPWKVSVVEGTPIHVAVGGFVARGVENSGSSLFLCRDFFGSCDPPTSFSILAQPFRDFPLENDDRIGTYEFDLVAPDYAPPAPHMTAQFGCSVFSETGCSIRYTVEFSVIEIPAATAPSSAPLAIGIPNFTGPAGTYITSATGIFLLPAPASAADAEGFQYRFHLKGVLCRPTPLLLLSLTRCTGRMPILRQARIPYRFRLVVPTPAMAPTTFSTPPSRSETCSSPGTPPRSYWIPRRPSSAFPSLRPPLTRIALCSRSAIRSTMAPAPEWRRSLRLWTAPPHCRATSACRAASRSIF
jgi:hypothetical protein